jgi:hypothetical protein
MGKRLGFYTFACMGALALAVWGCSSEPGEDAGLNEDAGMLGLTDDVVARRSAEVDAWREERSRSWEIVDTVVMPSGQVLDFVTVRSLYGVDHIAQPPPARTPVVSKGRQSDEEKAAAGDTSAMNDTLTARTEYDESGIKAPPGTVPMPRLSFSAYINGDHRAASLQEYLEKTLATPLPSYNSDKKLYTSKADARTHLSNAAQLSMWNFAGVNSDEMSLMQSASLCWGTSPATTLEAIEVGFVKYPGLYSNSDEHIFTYFRTAGGGQGNRVGGWDELQTGFIRNTSATFFPGASMASSNFSTIGGPYYTCDVETQMFNGQWWVYACGQWMGYYPTQNAPDASNKRITFDMIGSNACEAQWYGEYWDPSVRPSPLVNWTNGDLGSGRLASDTQAAWVWAPRMAINTLSNVSAFNGGNAPSGASSGYDPDCYSLSNMLTDGSGTAFFRLGGPGGNGSGCN